MSEQTQPKCADLVEAAKESRLEDIRMMLDPQTDDVELYDDGTLDTVLYVGDVEIRFDSAGRGLSFEDALASFHEIGKAVFEEHGEDDEPALSEAWSNYTDSLCKDGEITGEQYSQWPGIRYSRATDTFLSDEPHFDDGFDLDAFIGEHMDEIREECYERFYEYGLSFDYVEPGTFPDQSEGYLRFQLSYGGPSEEIRFFVSPSRSGYVAHRIEFWYMDWFDGAHVDVTEDPRAKRLYEVFNDEWCAVESAIERAVNE